MASRRARAAASVNTRAPRRLRSSVPSGAMTSGQAAAMATRAAWPGQALPPAGAPEIAIAGRSNVGKSTLLNRLAGRRALARTSKTPGRTRGVLFYELKARFGEVAVPLRLVDLPGYGYAQVSHD